MRNMPRLLTRFAPDDALPIKMAAPLQTANKTECMTVIFVDADECAG